MDSVHKSRVFASCSSTATYVDGQRIEVQQLGVDDGANEGQVEREGKNNIETIVGSLQLICTHRLS